MAAATTDFGYAAQNHDSIFEQDDFTMASQTRKAAAAGGDGPVPDITAPQKMISAMSGSLVTSLLGMIASQFTVTTVALQTLTLWFSHAP